MHLAINRDVTQKRRADLTLSQAREELEERVQQRTAELRKANEKLQSEVLERQRTEEALRETEQRLLVDITQRKRAEEALQAANETLRKQAQLLDVAQEAILVRHLDSSITFWNRGAEQTYWVDERGGTRKDHA